MAELQKEYIKACRTHDPTLLKKAKEHAKILHDRINTARLNVKHRLESDTLLVELVFLNCLVEILLLKQINTGIANVLCIILTAVSWIR